MQQLVCQSAKKTSYAQLGRLSNKTSKAMVTIYLFGNNHPIIYIYISFKFFDANAETSMFALRSFVSGMFTYSSLYVEIKSERARFDALSMPVCQKAFAQGNTSLNLITVRAKSITLKIG